VGTLVKKLLYNRMRVSDLEEAVRFYTEVLGLEVVRRNMTPRGSQLAFLRVPNSEELVELSCFPPSGPVQVPDDLVFIAFEVENMDDTIRILEAKQVKITDGPTQTHSGSRFLFINTPDGYEIELVERSALSKAQLGGGGAEKKN